MIISTSPRESGPQRSSGHGFAASARPGVAGKLVSLLMNSRWRPPGGWRSQGSDSPPRGSPGPGFSVHEGNASSGGVRPQCGWSCVGGSTDPGMGEKTPFTWDRSGSARDWGGKVWPFLAWSTHHKGPHLREGKREEGDQDPGDGEAGVSSGVGSCPLATGTWRGPTAVLRVDTCSLENWQHRSPVFARTSFLFSLTLRESSATQRCRREPQWGLYPLQEAERGPCRRPGGPGARTGRFRAERPSAQSCTFSEAPTLQGLRFSLIRREVSPTNIKS